MPFKDKSKHNEYMRNYDNKEYMKQYMKDYRKAKVVNKPNEVVNKPNEVVNK